MFFKKRPPPPAAAPLPERRELHARLEHAQHEAQHLRQRLADAEQRNRQLEASLAAVTRPPVEPTASPAVTSTPAPLAGRTPEHLLRAGQELRICGDPRRWLTAFLRTPPQGRCGLVVLGGPAESRLSVLEGDELTLGRSDTHVVLDDERVSRRHAALRREGGFPLVVDLQSTNGTYVNGERVRHYAQLRDGDEVRVGGTRLRFLLGDRLERAVQASSPRPTPPASLRAAARACSR